MFSCEFCEIFKEHIFLLSTSGWCVYLSIGPIETSENLWFSDVFREYRNDTLDWNMLIKSSFS